MSSCKLCCCLLKTTGTSLWPGSRAFWQEQSYSRSGEAKWAAGDLTREKRAYAEGIVFWIQCVPLATHIGNYPDSFSSLKAIQKLAIEARNLEKAVNYMCQYLSGGRDVYLQLCHLATANNLCCNCSNDFKSSLRATFR